MDGADDPGALRPASITIDENALERARLAFHRAAPLRSAKRVFYWTQLIVFSALGGALYLAIRHDRALTWQVALAISYALFAATVAWRFYAAANITPVLSRLGEPKHGVWPSYTLLCPLYREADVISDLIASIDAIDYPRDRLDVKLLVESDDSDTISAALAAVTGPHIEIIIVPAAAPRTKPKAINAALERARGELVCVYDAEDRPHPLQLRVAALAFEDGGPQLACVQAPLAIDNGSASWISRQFAAEYAIQFREIVPMLSRLGLPLPLGGSSNHFRTDALRAVGGWDAYNVSEDRQKFARRNRHLQRGTHHVPLLSRSVTSAW
jgi:cellulose synthase/poly-beta-1,6-N-acetylglucosamine synthase-like glycosyltransferase